MKLATALIVLAPTAALAQPAPNTLTPAETAAGWKLLFDGKSTNGWRGYKQDKFPTAGWTVTDGCIVSAAGENIPDIITTDKYGDFELTLEWKSSPKGNSGIIYRCDESLEASWQTGPEYQLLDDPAWNYKPDDVHSTGALYDIFGAPADKKLNPAGEFNTARIVVANGLVQHFLNGAKVVETRIDTDDWTSRIAKSKYKEYKNFGLLPKGFIALQHHGGAMWFRNIKIRDLAAPMPGEIKLFDGKTLQGWTGFFNDGGKLENIFSVKDGIIIDTGNPVGYMRTVNDYTSFVLKVEWRFNPVTKKAGNSGVLFRMTGADKVWPKSIEAQLQSENAGDFWCIDEFPMKTDPARTNGRNTKKLHGAEHPVGEWNEYEIIVDGGNVTLFVNHEMLNSATDCQVIPGKICLQAEGAEIHFRNIRLAPIESKPQRRD